MVTCLDSPPPSEPQHNVLISIPRTASDLVTHLLALPFQPSVVAHPRNRYFFIHALLARFKYSTFTRPLSAWSTQGRINLEDALVQSSWKYQTWTTDAGKEGSGTYVKEHVNWIILPEIESAFLQSSSAISTTASRHHSKTLGLDMSLNPTIVPSTFWKRVRTTLLIRHLALTFPSALRTTIDNEGLKTALREESESVMQ